MGLKDWLLSTSVDDVGPACIGAWWAWTKTNPDQANDSDGCEFYSPAAYS